MTRAILKRTAGGSIGRFKAQIVGIQKKAHYHQGRVKGGETMPILNYLSEFDKIKSYQKYRPIISELSRGQLETLVLMLLNGAELDYSVDLAMSFPREG